MSGIHARRSAKTASSRTAAGSGRSRSKQRAVSPVVDLIRVLWPKNTAPTLAAFAGLKPRQAEYVLSGRYRLSEKAMRGLARTEHGLAILRAWLTEGGAALPLWWDAFEYEAQMAEVRALQAALREKQKDITRRLKRR